MLIKYNFNEPLSTQSGRWWERQCEGREWQKVKGVQKNDKKKGWEQWQRVLMLVGWT